MFNQTLSQVENNLYLVWTVHINCVGEITLIMLLIKVIASSTYEGGTLVDNHKTQRPRHTSPWSNPGYGMMGLYGTHSRPIMSEVRERRAQGTIYQRAV